MSVLVDMPKRTKTGLPEQSAFSPFTSKAVPVFLKQIPHPDEAHMLDLGPVCNENINLFASRLKKLFVFDIFTKKFLANSTDSKSKRFWRHLDYSPETFDGIVLWDLPDRLDDEDAHELGRRCNNLLKPEGITLVWATGQPHHETRVNAFAVDETFQIAFRDQPHLKLPLHPRKTRDLFDVLNPLIPVQSFIFRSGLREFVLKKGNN